jgi:hypothetical protein
MKQSAALLLGFLGAVAAQAASGLSGLPASAQGPVSAALGKDNSRYWVQGRAGGFRAENPRQAMHADFTQQGAEICSQSLRWGLEVRGYGYGDSLQPVNAVAPTANANRVEYRRDGMTEWYENGPLGLEQGFTLTRPPGKENGQALTLELALRGDLIAALEPGGKGLELRRRDGRAVLRYTGLEARDATGRELRSWLEVRGERLLVQLKDSGAQYPVIVDPWVQLAELTPSDGGQNDKFGWSVAISGSTIVVGSPYHTVAATNQSQGAAYVFVQSGGAWTQQAELAASDGAAGDLFGWSVAVSGGTAVVGAINHTVGSNTLQGAAYVFVQSGTTWSQQWELVNSDGAHGDSFGWSVAVSGSTALVGTIYHDSEKGAAYVFAQGGSRWSQQAELTASDGAAGDEFGNSVALSGSTALVGAGSHDSAYVFVGSGGTWTQQAELTESNPQGGDGFGSSVALSGSTALVGAPDHMVGSNYEQGEAYVFVQSGGTWSQQAELTASDGIVQGGFGQTVALSGGIALLSGAHTIPSTNNEEGGAYVFVQSGTTWSQQAELTGSDENSVDQFGRSVALSGSTAVVSAPYQEVGSAEDEGAVYVFSSVLATISVTPSSGSGSSQAFTAVYSDSNGASDISEARMLINSAESAANACYVRYVASTGDLELLNNAGSAWSAGITPGGSGSESNSQCTLSGSGSSVTLSGNTLTVVFNISFTGFSGAKDIWLYAVDDEGQNTGLNQLGTFTAEGSTPEPETVSLSPTSGSGASQAFTAVYSDASGASDLSEVRMLINSAESATNACYVRYVPATGELELLNNAGSAWSAGIAPGGSGSVSNGQCILEGSGSSATASGDTLTVVFNVEFQNSFEGTMKIWLYAVNDQSENSGLNYRGTYTVVVNRA